MRIAKICSRNAQAVEYGLSGHSCSQAILAAYGPCYGLDERTAMRLASGLAGGIGHSKGVCGAVSAACLVIGLAVGPGSPADTYDQEQSIVLCGEFLEQYTAQNGSVLCSELCFKSLPPDADGSLIRESGIPEKLIRDAGELIETLLAKA